MKHLICLFLFFGPLSLHHEILILLSVPEKPPFSCLFFSIEILINEIVINKWILRHYDKTLPMVGVDNDVSVEAV